MSERDKYWRTAIAILVGCVLAVIGVMLVVQFLEARHDPPPTDTVGVEVEMNSCRLEEAVEGKAIEETAEPTTPPVAPSYVHPEYDNYLNWRNTYPEGYDHLITLGRWYVHGIGEAPNLLIDPMMRDAAIDAYDAYCVTCFVTLSGFPHSPYAEREYALHMVRTCRERGRDWTVALAICREESTFGLAGRNHYGVLDRSIDMTDQTAGYCSFLDKHCGNRDELSWMLNCGGYNPSSVYRNNIARLSRQMREEAY